MENLLNDLISLLSQDDRLVSEGKLLKNKVVELAMNLDTQLIRLLLRNDNLKTHFFSDADDVLVFDKVKFQQFVSNKAFLPDSFTAYKNKIGLTHKSEYLSDAGEVVLDWPYKDCVLEGGQTKDKEERTEIFWNTILAPDQIDRILSPKVLTNFSAYDHNGQTEIKLGSDNNFIMKGNNLLALHSLAQVYENQIKLIYIDPPYNTGGDSFKYNDKFNHSTWLTFMKNRLEVSKKLLKKDGFIFISIDDNEHHYLKILCDEVFGRENYVSDIIIQSNKGGRDYLKVAKSHEYILCYQKSDEAEINEIEKDGLKHPLKDSRGGFSLRELRNRNPKFNKGNRPNLYYPFYVNPSLKNDDDLCAVSLTEQEGYTVEVYPLNSLKKDSCWRWGNPKSAQNIAGDINSSELVARKKADGGWNIYEKHRKTTAKVKSIWDDSAVRTEAGTIELRKLLEDPQFAFPKPIELIKRVIQIATNDNDIVLDFFAGSGTTGQAVLEVNEKERSNRRFILMEQMDYVNSVTVPRIAKVIKNNQAGKFIYCELAKANQAYLELIMAAKSEDALMDAWTEVKQHAFLSFKTNVELLKANEQGLKELPLDEQKTVLIDTLDKNMLYIPLSEIEDETFNIAAGERELNKQFYRLS